MERRCIGTVLLVVLFGVVASAPCAEIVFPPLPEPADVAGDKPTPENRYSAVPVAEDDALIFPPDAEAVLRVKAANRSEADVRLVAAVRDFQGVELKDREKTAAEEKGETVVAFGVRRFYRIDTLPDKTVGQGETLVKAGAQGELRIPLGKMPPGFYMVDLTFFRGAERLSNRKYPLGVFEKAEVRKVTPPAVPVAVYSGLMHYRRTTEPVFWKTYVHAVAHDLKKHNLNAVVACGGFDTGEVNIYNRYGIAGISRGGRWLDHSGVIASFISDEPKPGEELERLKQTYDELRKKSDKIITTCMVGDGMGLTTPADPVNLWKVLQPKVRVFRWYGIKKHHYGVLHHIHYKGRLRFTSILRIAEISSDTPWWVILPGFGGDHHEAYFQNPSPAQMRSMMHLSLAYGADGLIFYLYQTGLVDPVTLKPRDGKLAAMGEVAGYIAKHIELLKSRAHGGLDIRCPSPVVEALPVRVGEQKQRAVYAVNKDPKNAVSTRLMLWNEVWDWSRAHDVFGEKDLRIAKDEEGYLFVPLELQPGEGRLIVTDADLKKK